MKGILDEWLDRGMKLIGILGFLGAAFIAINGFTAIPKSLADTKKEVEELKDYRVKTDLTLQSIQQSATYTADRVDKIETKIDKIYELVKRP